jgi:hypothetical protein
MSDELLNDVEALLEEVGRYLAAIDLFRAVDCEPTWRHEWVSPEGTPGVEIEKSAARSAH